jgi:hypothetical protein
MHNGSDFHYVVKYRRYADPFNTEVITKEFDWRVGKMVIRNQPTYTQYQISVKTANEKGISRGGDKWIDGYSGEDSKCLDMYMYYMYGADIIFVQSRYTSLCA